MADFPSLPFGNKMKFLALIVVGTLVLVALGQGCVRVQPLEATEPGGSWQNEKMESMLLTKSEIKVVTYNIHGGIGLDGVLDFDRIAEILKREAADFICLNEVDMGCARSQWIDTMAELEKRLGMRGYFACALAMSSPVYAIQGEDVGEYGIAMFSPYPMRLLKQFPLPSAPGSEPRTCAVAEISHPNGTFLAMITHFCHLPQE